MAWLCDVCGQKIHLKILESGKKVPVRCPLESYKVVKSFYSLEFRNLINSKFFDTLALDNSPEDLIRFKSMVPDTTELSKFVRIFNSSVVTKSMVVQAHIETFFLHFNRVLINIFDSNDISFIDPTQEASYQQFSYLWLSPTHLRESYFTKGAGQRFKNLSELSVPSLVIYPIGSVTSNENSAWGKILMDLLTFRESLGKPTWIVNSEGFNKCMEIRNTPDLLKYLNGGKIPTVILDDEIEANNSVSTRDYLNNSEDEKEKFIEKANANHSSQKRSQGKPRKKYPKEAIDVEKDFSDYSEKKSTSKKSAAEEPPKQLKDYMA